MDSGMAVQFMKISQRSQNFNQAKYSYVLINYIFKWTQILTVYRAGIFKYSFMVSLNTFQAPKEII